VAFLRQLVKRGLKGVRLVISDAHEGLRQAIAKALHEAAWQRSSVNMAGGGRVPLVISAVGMRT
jgi:putative transposase